MTLHIFYNNNCEKCGAHYIPYEKHLPCPNCGNKSENYIDYIEEAKESVMFNLSTGGSYMPAGFLVNTLGDHILHLIFQLLDHYSKEKRKPENQNLTFSTCAKDALSKMQWGDQQYLQNHIYEIACLVFTSVEKSRNQKP